MNNDVGKTSAYVALFSEIAFVLLIAVLAGTLGGYWLDQRLGTNPVFALIGFALGSIGGAVAYDMDPAENIVGNADGALFRAKAAGRNRVSMHPSPEVLGNQRFTKQTV